MKCLECDGTGELQYSECCGIYMSRYPDSDICPDCGEHTGLQECEDCEGTGEVSARIHKMQVQEDQANSR